MRDQIILYLNGKRREIGVDQASMMLADFLRQEASLTGTKIVCAEGDCGACTVLRLAPKNSGLKKDQGFLPINSCVTTMAQMDGSSLVTVDALRGTPVQKAMVECHGSRCGFCTPGFVMALSGLVEKKKSCSEFAPITPQEAKNALTGNLCRCTGYQPIIDAAIRVQPRECDALEASFVSKEQSKELKQAFATPLRMQGSEFTFFAPTSIKEAAVYLKKNPAARLIAGGTDLGVLHNKRKQRLARLVSLHLVPELYELKLKSPKRVSVGARVTLSELRHFLEKKIPEFATFLDLFASPQIKNVATLIGNIGNASPIADTPPFLLVAEASLSVIGPKGKRSLPLEKYYLGYRKTALQPGEVIVAIDFDIPAKSESVALYKVSQRKDLDISAVNTAFRVTWEGGKRKRIGQIRIALGGVAATPVRLPKTESALQGAEPTPDNLARAVLTLQSEITPLSDLRGSSAYRRVVAENLFHKFFRIHAGAGANK